jgi:hypothetical protein
MSYQEEFDFEFESNDHNEEMMEEESSLFDKITGHLRN